MWCIHTAIELEKKGLAAVNVCTTNTASLVRDTGKAEGFPDLVLVAVPHPIAGNDEAAIKAKADHALEEMIQALTTPPNAKNE